MNLMTPTARAYVYAGNWVADCPRSCGSVELLYERDGWGPWVRKAVFRCSHCNLETRAIEWAEEENEITAVLERRPIPHTRNWYPKDHEVAVRFGIPHGQSVQDLVDENTENGIF